MKKLLLLAFSALFLVTAPVRPLSASAAGSGYSVVLSREAPLLSSPDGEELFLLPYTYCVRVLEEGEEYCAVEYGENGEGVCAVRGYCRTSDLRPLGFVPSNPFLRETVTVTYEAASSPSPFGQDLFRTATADYAFYGVRYAESGECYLCLYGTDPATGRTGFGYLKGDPPDYPLNEDYLPASVPEGGGVLQERGGLTAAHIVAISLGCLAVAGIAVFLLRGKTAPREEVSDF